MAVTRADDAVLVALAPVCVTNFERAGNATANRAAFDAIDRWSRADFIEEGGWATVQKDGSSARLSAVARACAELLIPGWTKPGALGGRDGS